MTMGDLSWGLMMMLVGMGVVFLLLLILMLVLMLIGKLDSKKPEAPAIEASDEAPALAATADAEDVVTADGDATPEVRIFADGLDEDQAAAITVAVIAHAENRRRKAAPETRTFAPGSQLHNSRWMAVGRGAQTQPFTRR